MIGFSEPKRRWIRGVQMYTITMSLGSKVVGELKFMKLSRGYWEIEELDVYDQGKGFGRLLVSHVETLAKRAGVKEVNVSAMPSAVGFWLKVGYDESGSRGGLYKQLTGDPTNIRL